MGKIEIKEGLSIHKSVFIADNATIIGAVTIGENSSVWFNALLRGDMEPVTVGCGTNIQDGVIVHVDFNFPTIIGDQVTVGHGAVLHGCSIGNNVLIGIRTVLLNGVQIGENSIIGAGSVIPENMEIPPNSLVFGIPGKVRNTTNNVHRERIEMNARAYILLAQSYLRGYKVKRG